MGFLILLSFFGLVLAMIYGNSEKRFIILILGTIFFPTTALFTKNPSISPQHIFLYLFFFLEFWKDRENFDTSVFKNPLSIPILLIFFSYVATAFFNSGLASKDMYYGVRDAIDTFGYLMAAFMAGRKIEIDSLARKLIPVIIIICIFGIIEAMFNANYPYKIVNSAFPIYDGLYNINGDVGLGQSWRTRTCFTTKHPTAFGTLLTTLFLFYLPYIRKEIIAKPKIFLLLALLSINIVACGSRTAIFCTVVGTAIYAVEKFSLIAKILVALVIAFSFSTIVAFMLENFQQGGRGRGSSLDFRTQQLVFSVMAIENSPIFGNGNKYTANNILEENDNGAKRAQDDSGTDMGGLESVVFTLLIDRGAIGLGTYYLLLLWIFIILFIKRNKYPEISQGFAILAAGTFYLTLSGTIGNSSSFIFLIIGSQLGTINRHENEDEDADEITAEDSDEKALPNS